MAVSDFSAFLKCNVLPVENVKFVLSNRFRQPVLDENGKPVVTGKDKDGNPIYETKPVEWEIKAISPRVDDALRRDCTKTVVGKRGRRTTDFDADEYALKLCAMCTVYPPLNAVDLQDNYGVKCAEDLLQAMLNAGEMMDYKAKVMEVNGFDLSMDELVEDAKN